MLTDGSSITNEKTNKTDGFINGVMILSVSTLICKVIGLLFKIPIINIVGIDSMAYFSSAYNIYMLLNSIAAAGLPVALSILVSRNKTVGNIDNIRKIFNISLALFIVLGMIGSLALFFGADLYSDMIGMPDASVSVKAIAPTLLFICISGALRGYFQGHEFMIPTAVSQLIESTGKLILGIAFAMIAIKAGYGYDQAAAAAIAGLSAGVLLSTVYLAIRKPLYDKKKAYAENDPCCKSLDSRRRILFELLVIAFPITLSSCVTSITSLADTALITNRLIGSGFSEDAAITLYSSYTNLAIPMFNLPPALITALSVSVIPALTASITEKNGLRSGKIFSSAVRLCVSFAMPAAVGMALYARPILDMIYPAEREACSFAAPLLTVLSAAIVFSCLTTVCNAVLQAYMKPALPIVAMVLGAAVKIIFEYVLVGTDVGIYGAPISTLACTFTILLTDIIFITLHTPHRIKFLPFVRTLGATAFSMGLSMVIYIFLSKTEILSSVALMITIVSAVMLYAVFALKFKVVEYSDIVRLPMGIRVAELLKKTKLIK